MPKESDADGETATTGDRLNKGDTVGVFAGSVDVADVVCTEESDSLSLGAVSLVAGSIAFAAALAF